VGTSSSPIASPSVPSGTRGWPARAPTSLRRKSSSSVLRHRERARSEPRRRDQSAWLDEALAELVTSLGLSSIVVRKLMEELRGYTGALAVLVAQSSRGKLDYWREQLGQFSRRRSTRTGSSSVFFFSPYFSTTEKEEGLAVCSTCGPTRSFVTS